MNGLTDPLWDFITPGGIKRVSTFDALFDDNCIRPVHSPATTGACCRFCLAIAMWSGYPGIASKSFLNRHAYFFDSGCLCQVSGVPANDPVGRLFDEIPTGTCSRHYGGVRVCKAGTYGVCERCCLLGLVTLPHFAHGGGGRQKSGVNGDSPVYAFRMADSWPETIRVNLELLGDLPVGQPSWVDSQEPGVLSVFTTPPRKVRLESRPAHNLPCRLCGETPIELIRWIHYGFVTSVYRPPWDDPFLLRRNGKAVHPGSNRSEWLDLARQQLGWQSVLICSAWRDKQKVFQEFFGGELCPEFSEAVRKLPRSYEPLPEVMEFVQGLVCLPQSILAEIRRAAVAGLPYVPQASDRFERLRTLLSDVHRPGKTFALKAAYLAFAWSPFVGTHRPSIDDLARHGYSVISFVRAAPNLRLDWCHVIETLMGVV